MKARLLFYGAVLLVSTVAVAYTTAMPGRSFSGPLPEPTSELILLEGRLRGHVNALATDIGVRNWEQASHLAAAREYIRSVLAPIESAQARTAVEELGAAGQGGQNVVFEISGTEVPSLFVVGAHYDSAHVSPGANDNASGVAAALELARSLAGAPSRRRIRFVFFANEEPPFFKRAGMGSYVHAMNARRRGDAIQGMLALETMGFYSQSPDSQHCPWPIGLLYPSRGNFVGFVGDVGSRWLVRDAIRVFREVAQFPSEGAALPTTFPGIDWSDHWAFRQAGYPAIMVTDTAPYRDPNYHRPTDTADRLDYRSLARVTQGLERVVRRLADAP